MPILDATSGFGWCILNRDMIRLTAFPSDMNLEQGRNPHLGYFWENGTKRNELNYLALNLKVSFKSH